MVNDDWVSDYCFNCRFTHSEELAGCWHDIDTMYRCNDIGIQCGDLVKFFDKGLSQVMNVVIMFIFPSSFWHYD